MTNEQLVTLIQNGEKKTEYMAALYDHMSGLIAKIAWKYRGEDELEDLKQEGYIGLYKAVSAYRDSVGVPFHRYAAFWIRQEIQRYIENCSRLVRIPSGQKERLNRFKKLRNAYLQDFGREPLDREVAGALDLTVQQIRDLKQGIVIESLRSLDAPVKEGENDEITLGDLQIGTDDIENSVVEEMTREELKTVLWDCVDELEEKQKQAIICRYKEGCTINQTGERIGLTFEAARQQEQKGLRELRKPSKARRLRPFLDSFTYSMGIKGTGLQRFRQTLTSATERAALRR